MTIILLFMSPDSWLQAKWIKAVWLILFEVIFNWDHLPQILISGFALTTHGFNVAQVHFRTLICKHKTKINKSDIFEKIVRALCMLYLLWKGHWFLTIQLQFWNHYLHLYIYFRQFENYLIFFYQVILYYLVRLRYWSFGSVWIKCITVINSTLFFPF